MISGEIPGLQWLSSQKSKEELNSEIRRWRMSGGCIDSGVDAGPISEQEARTASSLPGMSIKLMQRA